MKFKILIALMCTTILVGFNSCSPEVDEQKEVKVDMEASKKEAKVVIDQFKEFWETENMELLSEIMSHDPDMINFGADATEYFVGWENLNSSVEQMLPAFDSTKINVQDQVIDVDSSGNVAWFSQIWNWDLSWQGTPVKVDGKRLTGVLEKRDGKWVIVQFHSSMPVIPE